MGTVYINPEKIENLALRKRRVKYYFLFLRNSNINMIKKKRLKNKKIKIINKINKND